MAGKENVVADCLSRPPEELALSSATKVTSVMVLPWSLTIPVAWDGSSGASTVAVVTPGPVLDIEDIAELPRVQDSCLETRELLYIHAKLAAQDMLISGHKV